MPDSPSEMLKAGAPSLLMETSQERGPLCLLEQGQAWASRMGVWGKQCNLVKSERGGHEKPDPNVYLSSGASSCLAVQVMEAPGSVSPWVNRCTQVDCG